MGKALEEKLSNIKLCGDCGLEDAVVELVIHYEEEGALVPTPLCSECLKKHGSNIDKVCYECGKTSTDDNKVKQYEFLAEDNTVIGEEHICNSCKEEYEELGEYKLKEVSSVGHNK